MDLWQPFYDHEESHLEDKNEHTQGSSKKVERTWVLDDMTKPLHWSSSSLSEGSSCYVKL